MARGVKTNGQTGWRHNIDANYSPNRPVTKQWQDMPEKIRMITERLQGVQIESQPALQIIERYRRPDVLIYADPPYLLSTRSGRMYRHEMTDDDHAELLDALDAHPGPVLLSGYANELYDIRLRHWHREERQALAEAGQTRTEVLWINPVATEHAGRQLTLF